MKRLAFIIPILLGAIDLLAQQQNFPGGGITPVAVLPGTPPNVLCSLNQSFLLPTGQLGYCPSANTYVYAGPFSRNVIDMANPKYGGFWDVQFCYSASTTVTVTNGQATVTCANGPFVSGDAGKRSKLTNGCCGTTNNITGVSLLPAGTTILSVQSATQVTLSANVAGTCAATGGSAGCIFAWGHNDDAAIALAEADWTVQGANGKCAELQWPASAFFISAKHWNTASTACVGSEPAVDYTSTIRGWGPGVSMAVVEPDFTPSITACPVAQSGTSSCWFGITEVIVEDLTIYGMGNGAFAVGGASAVNLVGPGIGSQFINTNFAGYGGGSTGPTLNGINMNATRGVFLSCDGFGVQCVTDQSSNTANSVCLWCFGGDTLGPALRMQASAGHRFIDIGGDWGVTTGTILIQNDGGDYVCEGCHGFNSSGTLSYTANNGTGLFLHTSGAQAHVTNGFFNNSACGAACNGVALVSGTKLYASGSTFGGNSGGGAVNSPSGGSYFDECGNTLVSLTNFSGTRFGNCSDTGTSCATGNFALTSGWGTSSVASVAAGGDNHGCHVTITGAAGAAGPVLTWTYPTTPLSAPGSCHLVGVSGTLTGVATGTPGATTVAFTFAGTPSAQTYVFDVGCP